MFKKSIWVVVAVVALALSLVACSGSDVNVDADMTAEEILLASGDAMANVDSYAATVNMQMGGSVLGESMDVTMAADMKYVAKPAIAISMVSDITMNMGGENEDMSFNTYIQQTDDSLIVYTDETGSWFATKLPMEDLDTYVQQDPAEMMDLFVNNKVSAEVLGTEDVDGVACYKMEIVLSSEALTDLMGGAAALGMDSEQLAADKDALAAAGDLSATVWIGQDDFMLVKEALDMSSFMTAMIASLSGGEADENAAMTMIMDATFFDYNAIDAIEIPAEALASSASVM